MRLLILLVSIVLLAAQQTAPPPRKLPWAAAASWGTAVVNSDGSVIAWPEQSTGQVVAVTLPGKAVQVAVHQYTAFALLDAGSVMAWGSNKYESLGVASTAMRDGAIATPQAIPGLTDIVQIAAVYGHAVALRRDGSVFAWGEEEHGLRGDSTPSRTKHAPVTQVPGLSGIVSIATAARHSLALTRDGRVFAWGENYNGELGADWEASPRGPAIVTGLENVVAIAAALDSSLALKSDGTVWAWGSNQSAMLGNGRKAGSPNEEGAKVPVPTIVKGLTNVRQIATGEAHALALLGDGTVRAWGFNGYGGIGNGTAGSYATSPVVVKSLIKVVQVNAGGHRSFATTADGRLWHWGTPIPVSPVKRPNLKLPEVLEW